MMIDIESLPLGSQTRLRLEHMQRERERAAAANAWGVLAKADPKAAGEQFLATVGHTQRTEMIRALEAHELLVFLRVATPEAREAVLATHVDRRTLERELAPEGELPRAVRIRRGAGAIGRTDRRAIDTATAKRLREIDECLVVSDGRLADERWWYAGFVPSDALMWDPGGRPTFGGPEADLEPEQAFLARLTVDPELVAMIRSGALTVSTHTRRGAVGDAPLLTAAQRG